MGGDAGGIEGDIITMDSIKKTINGHVYTRERHYDGRWDIFWWVDGESSKTVPAYVCQCGNNKFVLWLSGTYEMTATCLICGREEVVYDG